jgi:hypothetical protein
MQPIGSKSFLTAAKPDAINNEPNGVLFLSFWRHLTMLPCSLTNPNPQSPDLTNPRKNKSTKIEIGKKTDEPVQSNFI